MTFITPSPIEMKSGRYRKTGRSAFTLVELMVSVVLTGIIMSGVLSTFVMFSRSGVGLANYSDMEMQARKALDLFGQDARMASEITWTSSQSLTLTVPTSGGGSVSYLFSYNPTAKTFTRQLVGSATADTLMTGVTALSFEGFKITGASVSLSDLTLAKANTKQIQLNLEAARAGVVTARNSHTVLSARFIMRNKKVTS
jgi:prepilin-type N-terminal cleavage/methylation domain-containing protein